MADRPRVGWRVKRREGLATLEEAVRWVDTHWAEQPEPPARLHQRGVEPESQLGAPRVAAVFWRYLTISGDAMESVSVTEACYHPRVRLREDEMVCACTMQSCSRLHCPDCLGMGTTTRTRDRFTYPMAQALDRLSREPRWYAVIIAMARHDWHWVKAGVKAEDALTAIRKLHSRYSTVPVARVAWIDKSESQQMAETAA